MPELPEVETVKNTLKPLMINKTITMVEILYPKMILPSDLCFENDIINHKITDIRRIGKYLLFILDNELVLISHLRMEGKYILLNEDEVTRRHSRVIFHFDDHSRISYDDSRCFGIMKLVKLKDLDKEEMISKLGPEPMNIKDISQIKFKLQKSNLPIKISIMDQSIISGLGNIYADEVLFASKINPLTPSKQITDTQINDIISNAKKVLLKAIELGGSTVKSYHSARGVDGKFQNELLAYGKKDSLCPSCGYHFKKIYVGGRGTTYCPCCQKYHFQTAVVGIVGKIASGKSTALSYFKYLGYDTISADEIVHNLYNEPNVIKSLSRYFKKAIIDGHIDKQSLKDILIKDLDKKSRLEKIIHPLVEEKIIEMLKNSQNVLTFIEVPLLFEANLDYLCDFIIGIDATNEMQVSFLKKRGCADIDNYLKLNESNNFENYKEKLDYIVEPNENIEVFKTELHNVLNKILTKLQDKKLQ